MFPSTCDSQGRGAGLGEGGGGAEGTFLNLQLKQIEGHGNPARVPGSFRIRFITIFQKDSGMLPAPCFGFCLVGLVFCFCSFFRGKVGGIQYMTEPRTCQKHWETHSLPKLLKKKITKVSRCPYTARDRLPTSLTAQCMHCIWVLALSHIGTFDFLFEGWH